MINKRINNIIFPNGKDIKIKTLTEKGKVKYTYLLLRPEFKTLGIRSILIRPNFKNILCEKQSYVQNNKQAYFVQL